MDLVEDRDPAFWQTVFDHPEVKPHMGSGYSVATLVGHPDVTAFRTTNGGYLFHKLDMAGRAYDLHAAYLPAGWGREAYSALLTALARVFRRGAQVITAHEVRGNWRSRPPRTFRFRQAGDFAPTGFGDLRTWVLTKADFEGSPARSRLCRQP